MALEGASLGLAAFTAFKEVYLLSKFIQRIIASASHHNAERSALQIEFETEFLFLRSLGVLFLQNDGVMAEDGLNQQWLEQIRSIFDHLRIICGDYARLAAEEDQDYQKFSPYLNQDAAISKRIEFSLALDAVSADILTHGGAPTTFKWVDYTAKIKNMNWRWAIFGRRKLEKIVANFQKWNGKLKEIIPLTLAVHPRYNRLSSASLSTLAISQDADRVGLAPHARLRQLNTIPASEHVDLSIVDCTLEAADDTRIPTIATLHSNNGLSHTLLVEYKDYSFGDHATDLGHRVRQLANLLSSAGDSDLRTLPFRGYIDQAADERYAFMFEFPSWSRIQPPTALHDIIIDASNRLSLPDRFYIAQTISKSIATFHADEWVHKSVRSKSIIFFEDQAGVCSYDRPFLAGFEFSRTTDSHTDMTYDEDVEKNIYRHPDRQGPPRASFKKTHDIYALGVVLLEIGLWQTAASIRDEAIKQLESGTYMNPWRLMDVYLKAAKLELPHTMGPSYRNAVLTCLQGSFNTLVTDPSFGMSFYDSVVVNLDMQKLFK